MIKAHVLSLADPDYLKTAARIVDIYNEHTGCNESAKLQTPSATLIIAVEGDSGGMLLDRCTFNDGSGAFYRIMFAGFDVEHRQKGYLKACLQAAEMAAIEIRFVELNPFDNTEIWAKVGFKNVGTWGFCLVASKQIEPFIHYGVSIGQPNTKKTKEGVL